MKSMIFLILVLFVVSSCNNNNHLSDFAYNDTEDVEILHPGKKLMETYCYACHSPTASHENRLAPPMIAIKKHYIDENTSKEEFVKNIKSWIENPNEKDAIMFGAVKRFGVMPKAEYNEKDIEQIADYLFDHALEQPRWFKAHHRKNKKMRKECTN